jgi:CBS domain containing-hemolysin-like protein
VQDTAVRLVIVLLLVVAHGWIEFAHAALMNVRRGPLRERAEAGDRQARRMLRLLDDPAALIVTKQLVLMIVRVAIAAIAVLTVFMALLTAADWDPGLQVVVLLVEVLLIAVITYVLGDLIPSAVGSAYAEQSARYAFAGLRLLIVLLRPLTALLLRIDRFVNRLTHREDSGKAITEEEIRTLVDEAEDSGTIEDEEREMIYSVLDFGETLAREVMIPRPDIVALQCDATLEQALGTFITSGHSRVPVYDESLDDIKGILYAKDLLVLWKKGASMETPIRPILRTAHFVPETKRADTLFKEMQTSKVHIAIVIDEYGGTAGLVTIEDLIEEIVGDIRDEFDFNEEAEYTVVGPDEWIVDGAMNLGDFNDLVGVNLPTDENDSIGGYIYASRGRVPEVGETLDDPEHGLMLRVDVLENRRIRKVYVRRYERPIADADADETVRGRGRREDDSADLRAEAAALRETGERESASKER